MSRSSMSPSRQMISACATFDSVVDFPKGKSHTTHIPVLVPAHSSRAIGREEGFMHTVAQL